MLSARNRIIPAILLPIINTLKAAAKSQTAAGATPEEARRRLAAIIQHAKSTVIKAALQARKNSLQASSAKETTPGLAPLKKNPLRMIPIFNTSRVKQQPEKCLPIIEKRVISSVSPDRNTPAFYSKSTNNDQELKSVAAPVKIEDGDTNILPISVMPVTAKPTQDNTEVNNNVKESANVINAKATPGAAGTGNIEPVNDTETVEVTKEVANVEAVDEVTSTENKMNVVSKDKKSAPIDFSSLEKIDEEIPEDKMNTEGDLNKNKSVIGKEIENKYIVDSNVPPTTNTGRTTDVGEKPRLITLSDKPLNESKPRIPIIFPLKRPQIKPEVNVINLVQNLVKSKIPEVKNESIDLGSNITDILSSTITNILPEITAADVKNYQYEDENVKYLKKTPRQVLNLDGLVPPSGRCITKAKRIRRIKKPSPDATISQETSTKASNETVTYTFDIPSQEEMQSKRSVALKYAKARLTESELNSLKKEINNVRKRSCLLYTSRCV